MTKPGILPVLKSWRLATAQAQGLPCRTLTGKDLKVFAVRVIWVCTHVSQRLLRQIGVCRADVSGRSDFSPPNGYVFGTKVPCSEGFEPPPKRHLAHKEGTGSKTVLIMQSIVKPLGHMWGLYFSGNIGLPGGAECVKIPPWQICLSLRRWQPSLGWMRSM